jgi:hypothetical protein
MISWATEKELPEAIIPILNRIQSTLYYKDMKEPILILLTTLVLFAAGLKSINPVLAHSSSQTNPAAQAQNTATPDSTVQAPEGPGVRGTIAVVIAIMVVIGLLFATRAVAKPKDP